MNHKYEKPSVRDLGPGLNTVQGVCFVGSVAQGTGQDCMPFGATASDAGCITGHQPGTTPILSCDLGSHPLTDIGCSTGYSAGLGCSTGNTPAG